MAEIDKAVLRYTNQRLLELNDEEDEFEGDSEEEDEEEFTPEFNSK